jgi:hypothetical protein
MTPERSPHDDRGSSVRPVAHEDDLPRDTSSRTSFTAAVTGVVGVFALVSLWRIAMPMLAGARPSQQMEETRSGARGAAPVAGTTSGFDDDLTGAALVHQGALAFARCTPQGQPTTAAPSAVTFAPSGQVKWVEILDDDVADSEVGSCVRRELGAMTVSPFVGEDRTVTRVISGFTLALRDGSPRLRAQATTARMLSSTIPRSSSRSASGMLSGGATYTTLPIGRR